MSMSTHVIGILEADDTFVKMKAAWDACKAAGAEPPAVVSAYFNDEPPVGDGMAISVPHREWREEMQEGIEIDVASIPVSVKTIRFFNSW